MSAITTKSLYESIGEERLVAIISEFYHRAFADPIIGHFFFKFDREELTKQQIDFARALLGGENRYRGKPLRAAHAPFTIRAPHFGRRQVLMREVLIEFKIDDHLRDEWLRLEERLRPIILKS